MKGSNFWLLFSGRLFSNIGDSLYAIIAMWLTFELTGSTLYTGIAGFLTMIPSVFQFLTGPYIDRTNLKSILITTQLLQFAFLLLVPLFYYFDVLTVHWLLLIMFITSCISEFAYPAESALLPRVVKENELIKANSYMSVAYQGTDILFMGIGGALLVFTDAPLLLFINAFLYLLTTILFTCLKTAPAVSNAAQKETLLITMRNYKVDLKEGVTYARKTIIPRLLVSGVVANAFLMAFIVNLPSIAEQKGGPSLYGVYMAVLSIGMLLGTASASQLSRFRFGDLTIVGFMICGVTWIAAAIVPSPIVSIILTGFSTTIIGVSNVMGAAIFQRCIEERLLGRVMSLMMSASSLAAPLGALLGGIIGAQFGSIYPFISAGIALILVSLYWLTQPLLRQLPQPEKCELELEKQESYQQSS
ncbi:MFS transporter [Shouchella lonarensis]|uniref:Transmembrane secretion effector n=1 Tax=Shouchella lonarensis TaxID=1464122 RepID=A0A1G6N8F1_9BACI|nr:MFS transporter [Shouchella lonarensis]SDC63657.1 Transmembrane secretion effector [Shouchella lonarensis]